MVVATGLVSVPMLVCASAARADAIGYVLNVAAGPGYNFANADQALAYGHGICDKIQGGEPYPQLAGEIKSDLDAADEYQASYLISQATQELCPQLIWRLRNSAAGYAPLPD